MYVYIYTDILLYKTMYIYIYIYIYVCPTINTLSHPDLISMLMLYLNLFKSDFGKEMAKSALFLDRR